MSSEWNDDTPEVVRVTDAPEFHDATRGDDEAPVPPATTVTVEVSD